MKKTKNLLTLAIVAILGLSFCGVFIGKANADTYKQTTIKYTFDDGESGYSFASKWCLLMRLVCRVLTI